MYLQIFKTQNYIFPNLVFSLKILKFHKFQSRHCNTFSLKEERAYSLKLHALILNIDVAVSEGKKDVIFNWWLFLILDKNLIFSCFRIFTAVYTGPETR